jgi:hypothetical protein
MTTFSDNSSVDHQIENVYKQAADLFDPDTVLDIEEDEYQRGVVELVTRLLGMDSDDKEDVASIISQHTSTAYRVTAADFGTGINGDALYIGPLEVAVAYVKQECEWQVTQTPNNQVRVDLDNGNCWGIADTPEMAWRYAVAAELYGNSGDTFEPFRLEVWKR